MGPARTTPTAIHKAAADVDKDGAEEVEELVVVKPKDTSDKAPGKGHPKARAT